MLEIFKTQIYTVLTLVNILFLFALYKKNNAIIDIAFGPFIFISSLIGYLYFAQNNFNIFNFICITLLAAWALRISSRIYIKNKNKPEDFRYKAFREEWVLKGKHYFIVRSYLQIFLLQGFIVFLMSITPTILFYFLSLNLINNIYTNILFIVFISMSAVGLCIEAISDIQLDKWIKNKTNSEEKIMKTGLWNYSRHPNYFGESLFWLGLSLLSSFIFLVNIYYLILDRGVNFGLSNFIQMSLVLIIILFVINISYTLILNLLLFVSGVPMLERKWDSMKLPEWENYKNTTSRFILKYKK